jgi:hypothetical protein
MHQPIDESDEWKERQEASAGGVRNQVAESVSESCPQAPAEEQPVDDSRMHSQPQVPQAGSLRYKEPPRPDVQAEGKAKRGRPRVLSAYDMSTICGLIGVGCSRRTAARYLGCSPATIINQMRRDEKFANDVRKAEVHRMVGPLQNLREQSNRSWRAAAWFLERTDREQFGRQLLEVASWQEVEKLFHSWADLSTESIQDPEVREQMKARAKQLISEVKRCHRRY